MEPPQKPYTINMYINDKERQEFQEFFKKHPYLRRSGLMKYLLKNFIQNNPDGIINIDLTNE